MKHKVKIIRWSIHFGGIFQHISVIHDIRRSLTEARDITLPVLMAGVGLQHRTRVAARWVSATHGLSIYILIMGLISSQITSLTIVYSTVSSDADKKNIKAPCHWALCGEFTGDRRIPRTNGQWRGKYFNLMTSSCTTSRGNTHRQKRRRKSAMPKCRNAITACVRLLYVAVIFLIEALFGSF